MRINTTFFGSLNFGALDIPISGGLNQNFDDLAPNEAQDGAGGPSCVTQYSEHQKFDPNSLAKWLEFRWQLYRLREAIDRTRFNFQEIIFFEQINYKAI